MSRSSSTSTTVRQWTSVFAATIMMLVGAFQFFQGLTALVNGKDFLIATPNYLFAFNATTWGWIHLLIGVIVAVAGFFVLLGNPLARLFGIFLAVVQAVVNFVWLPAYPLWGIVIIALDVLIIWSLLTVRIDAD